MIDPKEIRSNPEAFAEACRKKGVKFDVQAFLKLDEKYREIKTRVEQLRSDQNRFSKELPTFKGEEKDRKLQEMKELAARLKQEGGELQPLEQEWERQLLLVPSIPLPEVPEGKSSEENVEVRREGEIPKFSFKIKSHIELGKSLQLFDIDRGVKVGGSRHYFLIGDGVRLQHAILHLAMDLLHSKGYVLFDPPHIVKYQAMMGTGYFPGGEEQAYHLDERDGEFYLIGTSEVSVCSYHIDEILDEKELPKRYAGYSPCYRREAGTYGKDTQGLYRMHQFYKVEQVIMCRNDAQESAKMHREILGNAEEVMRRLELPYRVVDVCTGDMGQGQVYKNDIEAWMPSRESYGETHSCSSFHEFQARRLGIRYKNSDGKNLYCHTLNNTCIASPRIFIPFLEVHQQPNGTVRIPAALQPYLGGQKSFEPKAGTRAV